mmetsp:Transcript_49044/g.129917  ORF Transcript_49044/g.129917 Transcript_49044/m.129917 type:complete len:104 (-) Transcript_49044:9-320(-)
MQSFVFMETPSRSAGRRVCGLQACCSLPQLTLCRCLTGSRPDVAVVRRICLSLQESTRTSDAWMDLAVCDVLAHALYHSWDARKQHLSSSAFRKQRLVSQQCL